MDTEYLRTLSDQELAIELAKGNIDRRTLAQVRPDPMARKKVIQLSQNVDLDAENRKAQYEEERRWKYAKESDKKSTVSSMLWGSQYDAMLNWMQENEENVYQGDSSKTNDSYDTGSEENDFIKNVFDLYGCHNEWTLEANRRVYRVNRGGSSGYGSAPSDRVLRRSDR